MACTILLWIGTAGIVTEAKAATRLELFDGHTLKGWHTWLVDTRREDPRGVFSVTNGLLRISGDGLGYLATEREFEDFRLEIEWCWGRLNNARKSMAWSDVLDFRGPRDAENPPGRWNHIVCDMRKGRVRIRLNGILVNEARDVTPSHGRILLQCEGSEILFRRVTVFQTRD